MEQNGHFKHALSSWNDLSNYANEQVERLNEETLNLSNLSSDEKILLDELNKLRAEVESNYISAAKSMEKQLQFQRYQQQQLEQSQAQQQQVQQNVPTLRTSIPHTLASRKPGAKMMKSLRPGGITAYSVSSPPSNSSTPLNTTPNQNQYQSSIPIADSAKQAANIIWAPSNSLNVNNIQKANISNSSLGSDHTPNNNNGISSNNNNNNNGNANFDNNYTDEFADFSTTIINKKTPSDRAKAALKASAAVKLPQHRQNHHHRSHNHRSRSPHLDSNPPSSLSRNHSNSPENSDSSLHSPTREAPQKVPKPKVPVPTGNEQDTGTSGDNNDDKEKEQEDKDESILKKIKGVDLKFAKNILVESSRDQDKVYWSDIAGLEQAKESLMETVVYPFLRPDLFRGLREPVSGMLLFGPPGTGKTMLARAAATESNSTFFSIQSSSLTSKWYGESEKLVRALFQVAKAKAPSIIFVDEIDSLLGKRSGDGDDDTSRRLKNEFLVQWSDLSKAAAGRVDDDDEPPPRVLVLAATNLPWAIDEAARRRFVRRQYIPLPEPDTRLAHFKKLLKNTKNSLTDEDMTKLVELTEGYSGSDITSLAKDAAIWPIRELGSKMLNLKEIEIRPMNLQDFERSMKNIRPSVNKEGLEKFEEWAREFGSSGA